MRPRHQGGTIVRKGSNWILRYYEGRVIGGEIKRVRTSRVLAPFGDAYRNKTDVKALAQKVMTEAAPAIGGRNIDGSLTLGEFVETRYFPNIERRVQMAGERI
jgi:hypothetical protein